MSLIKIELSDERDRRKRDTISLAQPPRVNSAPHRALFSEEVFTSMLYLERRRAERTNKRFVLMLVDVKRLTLKKDNKLVVSKFAGALAAAVRETDVIGWYVSEQLIGVIGTELGETKPGTVKDRLLERLRVALPATVGFEKDTLLAVSFHFFPEDSEGEENDLTANMTFYPELAKQEQIRKFALGVKRSMDILGSSAAIILLSPVYAAVALAIKLTSKGPVFFRQQRMGMFGKQFTLLKFRSMRTNCDVRLHQEYVRQFIAGQIGESEEKDSKTVFKIQKDPRITPIGAFLRKTSLDELPQFWNVLCGEMSLVGPRPPIRYEFQAYNLWHRRRVLEIKPGITGLWQVQGRSRTRFDDMVRLDLKYARGWSLWLDLKILLQTPAAVVIGDGAH